MICMEENLIRTSTAVGKLQDGLCRKFCIEACVSLLSGILNAVSMGIAGGVGQAAVAATLGYFHVDFGDVPHICNVARRLRKRWATLPWILTWRYHTFRQQVHSGMVSYL